MGVKSIFDFVTADAIVAYWEELTQNDAVYLGEELFPSQRN